MQRVMLLPRLVIPAVRHSLVLTQQVGVPDGF